jgi:hypothetical protein
MEAEALLLEFLSCHATETFLDWLIQLQLWDLHKYNMRLILAKVSISLYLLFLTYSHLANDILDKTFRETVQENIARLDASERSKEFLKLYLVNLIYFMFGTSVLMVFSRNVLPKLVNAAGIALWIYFGTHPNMVMRLYLQKMFEEICLIGGLLFIAGS